LPLPILAALDLQTKAKGEKAASTTAEEFEDNMWMIVYAFATRTGVWPVLSYDNNKIQVVLDVRHIEYAQGQEGKEVFRLDPTLNKVDLPTYSPDMNRAIEHVFAGVKQRVRAAIYAGNKDFTKSTVLQSVVHAAFDSLPPGAVRKDVYSLPVLWHVLSAAKGVEFEDPPGTKHVGTGGGYPPCRYT
jgi:hypothetical protein